MTRTLAAFFLMRCVALVFGACAFCCSANPQLDVAGPVPHTRVVLRFDVKDDAKALDSACDVLRKRLKELEATDISVNRRKGRDVAMEFRAPKDAPLDKDSELIRVLSQRGDLCFYIAASEATFTALGKDMHLFQPKIQAWLEKPENAQVPLSVFNALTEAQGGPPTGIRWFTRVLSPDAGTVPRAERLIAVSIPKAEWTFTGKDLASVEISKDRFGFSAASILFKPDRTTPFGDFTGAHVGEPLAIVFNDEIVAYANIGEKLPGQCQIYGRFDESTVKGMVAVLRSGELPSKPALVSVEQVD